jgi:carboxylesterase type B
LGKIDAQHDTAPLVEHSITTHQSIIGVALQYRLGPLGFLHTPNGNKNLGLYDQRNALIWIQRFIAGFGGDPARNTLFGESAGGYSICCHMLAQPTSPPLFNRVIIMSGVLGPMMCPVNEAKGLEVFRKICKTLGIEEEDLEALKRLKELDVLDLVRASDAYIGTGAFYPPIEDDRFFREGDISWDKIPKLLGDCKWVDSFVVGCTGFEVSISSSASNVELTNALKGRGIPHHSERPHA